MNRIPPMVVCPLCGPRATMYAGRVISRVCQKCREELESAR